MNRLLQNSDIPGRLGITAIRHRSGRWFWAVLFGLTLSVTALRAQTVEQRPLRVATAADTTQTAVTDTLAQSAPKAGARRIKVTQRNFVYRDQIRLALGTMVFILIVMTTAQNWNP